VTVRIPLLLLGLVLAQVPTWAQQADPPPPPPDQAPLVVVWITPRVVEGDQTVSWEQPLSKTTRPGVPVVVNIDADTLAIRISVTPFVRGKDFLLVVQGRVKQTSGGSTRQSTSLQSLLVPAGEPMAYFPLGREPGDQGRQMVVMMRAEFQGD
jgi:hypothetical protein